MKRFLLIPDSFKGTMSSETVCGVLSRSILRNVPDAVIHSVPVADGGEGTTAAFLAAVGGEKVAAQVQGPFGKAVCAFFGLIDGGRTAVIETAAAAGLPLAGSLRDPCRATTFGVGQLVAAALDRGCEKIIIGLGGSCTNDGGTGAAAALGVRFLDKRGNSFVPVGGTLSDISRIDVSDLDSRLHKTELIAMCDVDSPLFGESGAAFIFAPQKGASPEQVLLLDSGLRQLANKVSSDLHKEDSDFSGAGAAGGLGYGLKVFCGAVLQKGIETVLDTVRFDELLKETDIIFTGEGKIDAQTLRGKVVAGVAARAEKAGVPVIAFVGDIGDSVTQLYDHGVTGIFSINRIAAEYETLKERAENDLYLTADNFLRTFSSLRLQK